jgi:sugar phosphate isomerase/epimerase
MWAVGRFATAGEFRRAAADLGFDAVEFNYEAPPTWFDDPGDGVPIGSLHNPCPASLVRDGRWSHDLSLGATDEDERREAVRLACATIANAARVGASAVVVHVATVPVDTSKQARLRALVAAGQRGSDEFWTVRDALAAERAAKAGPHVEQSIRSVRELAAAAAECGVSLGLETRYNVYEIPNLDEAQVLLDAGRDGPVGYWHDVGHAAGQELLGFGTHRAWLETLGPRIIGVHLHELRGVTDHFAIAAGDMDWPLVAAHLPANARRVCEFDRRNPPEDVAKAFAVLQRHGII